MRKPPPLPSSLPVDTQLQYMRKKIPFIGETNEQALSSFGKPAAMDYAAKRDAEIQIWKYYPITKVQYALKLTFTNGILTEFEGKAKPTSSGCSFTALKVIGIVFLLLVLAAMCSRTKDGKDSQSDSTSNQPTTDTNTNQDAPKTDTKSE